MSAPPFNPLMVSDSDKVNVMKISNNDLGNMETKPWEIQEFRYHLGLHNLQLLLNDVGKVNFYDRYINCN